MSLLEDINAYQRLEKRAREIYNLSTYAKLDEFHQCLIIYDSFKITGETVYINFKWVDGDKGYFSIPIDMFISDDFGVKIIADGKI